MRCPHWIKDGLLTCYPRPDFLENSKRRLCTQYAFSNGKEGEDGERGWSVPMQMTDDMVMLSVSPEHVSLAPTSAAPRTAISLFHCQAKLFLFFEAGLCIAGG